MVSSRDDEASGTPSRKVDIPSLGPQERSSADRKVTRAFKFAERALLVSVVVMTLIAAGQLLWTVWQHGAVALADMLLMFLFVEVISMVTVYYSGGRSSFLFPILIAITALARLILLQGKDMAAENVVFEALAILLLAIAVMMLRRRISTD